MCSPGSRGWVWAIPVVVPRGCLVIAPGVLVRRGCSRCDWLALPGWFAVVWVVLGWLVVAGGWVATYARGDCLVGACAWLVRGDCPGVVPRGLLGWAGALDSPALSWLSAHFPGWLLLPLDSLAR